MEQVLTAKQESMDACQATVTYEPLPTVMGDATQLRTLFAELLDNALKFCSSELPKIHIGVERRAGRWLLAWHDNGIGIERRHYDRIFVIFQRLGFKENAPGMGLGLALCRRILERHRGVIWVESTPTKGSTFFVQLPASPATKEQK